MNHTPHNAHTPSAKAVLLATLAAPSAPLRRLTFASLITTVLTGLLLTVATAPALAAPEKPQVGGMSVSVITTTCATFHAAVNPDEAETTYQFEYLTQAKFEKNQEEHKGGFEGAEPTPASSLAPDNTFHNVSAEVCGLTHPTSYTVRIVASNEFGAANEVTDLVVQASFTTHPNGPSHALAATIAGSGTDALSGPTDVAVVERPGPELGDLYVTDPGNHRVEKFTPSGQFVLMFGSHVNKNGADVCEAGEECQPGTAAPETPVCGVPVGGSLEPCSEVTDVPAGALDTPTFLAVDNSPEGEGDVYVADNGTDLVQKFDAFGHLITGWGEEGKGQKDGRDVSQGESFWLFGPLSGIAVAPDNGNLYVGANNVRGDGLTEIYNQQGRYIPPYHNLGSEPGLVAISSEAIYGYSSGARFGPPQGLRYENPELENNEVYQDRHAVTAPGIADTGFALDSLDSEIYVDEGSAIVHYSPDCEPAEALCEPLDSFGAGQLSAAAGIAVFGTSPDSRTVYVAEPAANAVDVFADIRPIVTTGAPEEVGETSITLTGHVTLAANEPGSHGEILSCHFQYGTTKHYGHSAPCQPDPETGSHFTEATPVKATVTGLPPITELPAGTKYHYRLVASNAEGGTAESPDATTATTAPPKIEGISSSHLAATSAELDATVKPNGLDTKYRFQYGTTTAYGQSTEEAEITGGSEELFEPQKVSIPLTGLQAGVTYHFRLLAENALDQGNPVISEDQSFEFFPPACPNSAVRQQTGSAYLPDCRAYELVSPGNANGTLYFSGGPNPGTATSPSRFAYVGTFGSPPGAEDTVGTSGDLYLATRTDTGWVSHYVGLPSTQAGCMSGPPGQPWDYSYTPDKIQDAVLTDPSMSRVLDWASTDALGCLFGGNGTGDASWATANSSNAPYLWSAEGELLGRLPAGLPPAAEAALRCPLTGDQDTIPHCTSEVAASADLNHLFFSSNQYSFSEPGEPAGLTSAPGSAYDEDLATGKLTLISRLPGGANIPSDPLYAPALAAYNEDANAETKLPEEYLRFPAVSSDGSHVLISTATAPTPRCGRATSAGVCPRFTDTPIHLYMSIDDAAVKNISLDELSDENVAVHYVGMSADGSKVFFTSAQHLTSADPEHGGTGLYMWSEEGEAKGHPLTLISKGESEEPGAPGNTAACAPASATYKLEDGAPATERPWTSGCGVLPYSGWDFAKADGGVGGNGIADTAIASANGDIYFFSPEQLDGARGIAGQQNLYDYRAGHAQFVASFAPGQYCQVANNGGHGGACSEGPIARFQVTPDDTHMAFLTVDRLTSYENAGHLEMYSYEPATGRLTCDSCNPSGVPASADASASQDGLFLTEDGRVFFSTTESLVPQDTNEGPDVYEFVDGRPQLITPGTGVATGASTATVSGRFEIPGLIGVSANGTDVYFSSFDTLTSEDHNGNFLKFYDARTDGGFPQPTPNQPCAAAEECHGPGTEPPTIPTQGTAATLAGGNAKHESHAKHHNKKHHRRATDKKAAAKKSTAKHKHHNHQGNAKQGGSK